MIIINLHPGKLAPYLHVPKKKTTKNLLTPRRHTYTHCFFLSLSPGHCEPVRIHPTSEIQSEMDDDDDDDDYEVKVAKKTKTSILFFFPPLSSSSSSPS